MYQSEVCCVFAVNVCYQVRVGMVLDGIIVISPIRTYICTCITCFWYCINGV